MKLVRRNPMSENGLETTLNHFFNDAFLNWPARPAQNANIPAVNISEDEDGFQLEMAVPGRKKEDFKIELNENQLKISTEQKEEVVQEGIHYSRREFGINSFSRSFFLPENKIDEAKISAQYEQGILRIALPKREEAKPQPARTIEIAG